MRPASRHRRPGRRWPPRRQPRSTTTVHRRAGPRRPSSAAPAVRRPMHRVCADGAMPRRQRSGQRSGHVPGVSTADRRGSSACVGVCALAASPRWRRRSSPAPAVGEQPVAEPRSRRPRRAAATAAPVVIKDCWVPTTAGQRLPHRRAGTVTSPPAPPSCRPSGPRRRRLRAGGWRRRCARTPARRPPPLPARSPPGWPALPRSPRLVCSWPRSCRRAAAPRPDRAGAPGAPAARGVDRGVRLPAGRRLRRAAG